jgi:glycosyltransferase involved in cell wall biosynthesis
MRITYFVPSPEGKGSFFRAFYLAKYLSKRGHDISLICGSRKPTFSLTRKVVDNVRITQLPTFSNLPRWIALQIANAFANVIFSLASSPDIIHAFSVMAPSSALGIAFSKALKTVTLRDCRLFIDWDDWWSRGGILRDYGKVVNTFGMLFEEKTPLLGDTVTVVSEVLKQRAMRMGIKKVYKIPNGSNIETIKPIPKSKARETLGLPKDSLILCHLGFTDLTEAYLRVKKHRPDALLLVIGAPPRYVSLRIPKLRKVKGIIYTGHESYQRIPFYLGASDILVLKTEDEIADKARWPIRIGDYLAAGRPIITGTGDIANEIHRNRCGYLVKPGDPEDLAEKILEMAAHEELWEDFGKRARALAESTFSWAKIAEDLERLYLSD